MLNERNGLMPSFPARESVTSLHLRPICHPSWAQIIPNHPKTGLATGPEQVFSAKVQPPIHQWIRRSQMNLEPILE